MKKVKFSSEMMQGKFADGTDFNFFNDIQAKLNALAQNTDVDKLISDAYYKQFKTSAQPEDNVIDKEGAKLRKQIEDRKRKAQEQELKDEALLQKRTAATKVVVKPSTS